MKYLVGALLALVVIVVAVGITGYSYLSPEQIPPAVAAADTVRTIDGGELIGYKNDLNVSIWQGIPFAAAPVGKLRWKAPRPPLPWTNRLQALSPGNECASQNRATHEEKNVVDGDEDCLYLNVFAPAGANNLPVMYWIHGGANTIGSGSTSLYDGSQLAARYKVILVSINYRLGNFGWLSHPALRSAGASKQDNSGNFGTLDQIHGLKWVQNNIAHFGGNPDKVTIFGESAGGWNVLAMMASPLAKGLFHGAIVQSGRLDLEPLAVAEHYQTDPQPGSRYSSREIINQLLILDGLATDSASAKTKQQTMSSAEINRYLRDKSTDEILAAYRDESGGKVAILPDLFADGHVLPSVTSSQQLFSDPNNYNAVPVILGTNRDEMKLFLSFNGDLVNTVLGIPVGIKNLNRYDKFNRYSTDEWKVNGVDSLATVLRAGQGDNVFAYRFDADDLRDLGLIDLQQLFGAAHALEIPYVFGNFPKPISAIYPAETHPARDELSNSMMSYWAAFAHTGNPGRGYNNQQLPWTAWQNGDASSPRLMILDSRLDGGIRMSSERLDIQQIKQRLFSDSSFIDQEEYCDAYKALFRNQDFNQTEYDNLGDQGCSS